MAIASHVTKNSSTAARAMRPCTAVGHLSVSGFSSLNYHCGFWECCAEAGPGRKGVPGRAEKGRLFVWEKHLMGSSGPHPSPVRNFPAAESFLGSVRNPPAFSSIQGVNEMWTQLHQHQAPTSRPVHFSFFAHVGPPPYPGFPVSSLGPPLSVPPDESSPGFVCRRLTDSCHRRLRCCDAFPCRHNLGSCSPHMLANGKPAAELNRETLP
ncbi:hypothetical protein CDEST_09303 [Colletotrichum destructivum]|uniref:Uncharacterized protein n=1 Tax=Colletotrichum destructivum TaxID=34406 RepID=A0AAX4ILV0_9PEZI|nr:hypothetical protein CDEST_09303 [Colletotrichum destructivum]